MRKIFNFGFILFFFTSFSQEKSNTEGTVKENNFSISASVGPAYKIGKRAEDFPSNLTAYIKNNRFGISYEFSVMYDINNKSSYGLKFENFESGTNKNNENILFIGASYTSYITTENPRNTSCLNFSFGYLGYTNNIDDVRNIQIKGSSLGMNATYLYYFGLSDKFQIGPKVSILGGALTKVDIKENGMTEKYKFKAGFENLFYLNASFSARYVF